MSSERILRVPIPDDPVYKRAFESMTRAASEIVIEKLDWRFRSNREALKVHIDSNHCFALIFQLKFMAIALMLITLPPETIALLDLDKLEVIPNKKYNNTSTGRFSEADMVYIVPLLGTDEVFCLFIILEHKTRMDVRAIFQASWYTICEQKARLDAMDAEWTLKRNQVRDGVITQEEYSRQREEWKETMKEYSLQPGVGMVIHQDETPYEGKTDTGEMCPPMPGLTEYYPHQKIKVFEMNSEINIGKADCANVRFLGLVLKVYRAIYSPVAPQLLKEVFEQMKEFFDDKLCCWIARVLETYALDYSKYFKGEKKREIVEAFIFNEDGEDSMISTYEEAINIGYDKGISAGYDKGISVGLQRQIRDCIEFIITLLDSKFPFNDLSDIQTRLEEIDDYSKLKELLQTAKYSTTLEGFYRYIKQE